MPSGSSSKDSTQLPSLLVTGKTPKTKNRPRRLTPAGDRLRRRPAPPSRVPKESVPEYHVTWGIDLNAADPVDAARKALAIQRNAASWATVFTVHGETPTAAVDLKRPAGPAARPGRRPRPPPCRPAGRPRWLRLRRCRRRRPAGRPAPLGRLPRHRTAAGPVTGRCHRVANAAARVAQRERGRGGRGAGRKPIHQITAITVNLVISPSGQVRLSSSSARGCSDGRMALLGPCTHRAGRGGARVDPASPSRAFSLPAWCSHRSSGF